MLSEIVELFKELFPKVKIMNIKKSLSKSHEKDKVNHHRHKDKLRKEGIIDVLFHKNPQKSNLLFKREERRDMVTMSALWKFETFYCPLEYLDKRS